MARLTDEEFRAWCQRNKIEPETASYIQRIRTAEPERKVRGRASNMSGCYPSQKMGFSIQFESQHVELWGCYTMERDEDVLEFYDQPARIQLHYHACSGRKTSPWHTPDFLVLRQDGAVFEEWKHASSLEKLAVTMPGRYQRQIKQLSVGRNLENIVGDHHAVGTPHGPRLRWRRTWFGVSDRPSVSIAVSQRLPVESLIDNDDVDTHSGGIVLLSQVIHAQKVLGR